MSNREGGERKKELLIIVTIGKADKGKSLW